MILEPINWKSRSAAFGAICAGFYYLYYDIKIITTKNKDDNNTNEL